MYGVPGPHLLGESTGRGGASTKKECRGWRWGGGTREGVGRGSQDMWVSVEIPRTVNVPLPGPSRVPVERCLDPLREDRLSRKATLTFPLTVVARLLVSFAV